jgi:CDP-diacylglycerol--glycerol-3-phosphate 3-phosphatidyltransferase
MIIEVLIFILVLAALGISLQKFEQQRDKSQVNPEVANRHASFLLNRWWREWLLWLVKPVTDFCIHHKIQPDLLNWAGVSLSGLAGLALHYRLLPLAGWLIVLGGVCDIFDGRVARALGIASPQGAFNDSTLDRFAEIAVYLGLLSYFQHSSLIFAIFLAITGSLMVSYTKARGESLGASCNVGIMQRPERIVLLALATLFSHSADALLPALGCPVNADILLRSVIWLIAISTYLTAFYRYFHIRRQLASSSPRPR